MALGRRSVVQQKDLFVLAEDMPRSDGHIFYTRLNRLLEQAGFDAWIEKLCAPYYSQVRGRPGIPPGVYFRMLLVGCFEGRFNRCQAPVVLHVHVARWCPGFSRFPPQYTPFSARHLLCWEGRFARIRFSGGMRCLDRNDPRSLHPTKFPSCTLCSGACGGLT
jgi:hypothetical protein